MRQVRPRTARKNGFRHSQKRYTVLQIEKNADAINETVQLFANVVIALAPGRSENVSVAAVVVVVVVIAVVVVVAV